MNIVRRRVVGIKRSGQTYVFRVDDDAENRRLFASEIGRMAGDPELDFTWYDAATLAKAMDARQELKTQ